MTKGEERREEIADYVSMRGHVRVEDLVEHFGVSRMTIHRHIDRLARQGFLRKLHGAVTVQPSALYESAFRFRVSVSRREKDALAKAALEHIEPGQVVLLDDSSTANAIAPFLGENDQLTVVTNSASTASRLAGVDGIEFICLGGKYHGTYDAYIGLVCEMALTQLRAHVLICSASAVTGTTAFIQDPNVVRVKRAMMDAASRRILLLDHTKFGKTALHVFEDLARFDAVLVTEGIGKAVARTLEEAGVKLQLVKAAP